MVWHIGTSLLKTDDQAGAAQKAEYKIDNSI